MKCRWMLCLLLSVTVACDTALELAEEFRIPGEGYQCGLDRAEWEWQQGAPLLYSYGYGAGFRLAPSTGLPTWPVAGCITDAWTRDLVKAHNLRMITLLESRKPQRSSLSKWEPIIEDPEAWFLEHAEQADPVILAHGEGSITSPDGMVSMIILEADPRWPDSLRLQFVWPGRDPQVDPKYTKRHLPGLGNKYQQYLQPGVDRIEWLWVADNHRLAVLSYFGDHGQTYTVVDLKTGGFIEGTIRWDE